MLPEHQGITAYTSCLFQIHCRQRPLMLHLLFSVPFYGIAEAMTPFFLPVSIFTTISISTPVLLIDLSLKAHLSFVLINKLRKCLKQITYQANNFIS